MKNRLTQLWLLALISATGIALLIVVLMLNQQINQEYQSMQLWSAELGNYARRQQSPPATLMQALTNQGYLVQLVERQTNAERIVASNSRELTLEAAPQVLQSGQSKQHYRWLQGQL